MDEEAGGDEDQGDDEEEVVLIKPPVANPYASKPKEKQVAKVFRIADGSYKGGDTPPKKKGRGKGGKGGRPKGSKNKEGHKAGGNRKGLKYAKRTKGQLTLPFDEPTEDTVDINEDGGGGDEPEPCASNGGGGSGDGSDDDDSDNYEGASGDDDDHDNNSSNNNADRERKRIRNKREKEDSNCAMKDLRKLAESFPNGTLEETIDNDDEKDDDVKESERRY